MANDIVWYHADEVGAPTLNNAAGSLIAVLDACLISGFRSQSLTSISVSGGVATFTLAGHGYEAGKMVDVSGATPSGLNGRKLILTAASGSGTFAAPGISDGAATGSINCKRSPLGWSKAATGTNKAIYARTDVAATAMCLRIDDTKTSPASAVDARALMVESWTDVDTYAAPAPTAAQLSGGQYWNKGADNANAKKWVLVGDSRHFWLLTESSTYPYSSSQGLMLYGFGDPVSYRAGDAFGALLTGGASASGVTATPFMVGSPAGNAPSSYGAVFSRLSSQVGAAVRAGNVNAAPAAVYGTSGPVYPSPVDNGGVFQAPALVVEENSAFGHPIRGQAPGLVVPLAKGLGALHLQTLTGVTGFSGSLLVVALLYPSSTTPGAICFDITNAWR